MGNDQDKKPENPARDTGKKPGPYGEGNYEATRKYTRA